MAMITGYMFNNEVRFSSFLSTVVIRAFRPRILNLRRISLVISRRINDGDGDGTRDFVVECLESPEEIAAYLEACIQESNGDAAFIVKALGDIAHAKVMTHVARETGLSRVSL